MVAAPNRRSVNAAVGLSRFNKHYHPEDGNSGRLREVHRALGQTKPGRRYSCSRRIGPTVAGSAAGGSAGGLECAEPISTAALEPSICAGSRRH